jgi:hypothetical protein
MPIGIGRIVVRDGPSRVAKRLGEMPRDRARKERRTSTANGRIQRSGNALQFD